MSGNSHLDSVAAMDRLLSALSEQLSLTGHEYDLIVIGGSALLALGLVSRATQDMLRLGLPEGFAERLVCRDYGRFLKVRFASRLDQIHFKLHATVDRGGGKHFADLVALEPCDAELLTAARWTRTHDPSDGFLSVLREVLAYFEVDDAALDT